MESGPTGDERDDEDFHAVIRCELALLDPAVRADPIRLDALLHPDFTEIGARGTFWSRDEIIASLVASPAVGDLRAVGFRPTRIADDVILLTFVAHSATSSTRRSSLWIEESYGWVVRFHQGTIIDPTAA